MQTNTEEEIDTELIASAEAAMGIVPHKTPLVNAYGQDKRWVNWKFEVVDGRRTKVPYQARGKALSTGPQTWVTYEIAKSLFANASKGFDGVGIIFTPEQTLLGIDLDHILDENGAIIGDQKETIEKLISTADTYCEVSPSGTGLHLYLSLSEPLNLVAHKKAPYELYTSGRFFTVTEKAYGIEKPVRTISKDEVSSLLALIGYPWAKGENKVLASNVQSQITTTVTLDDEQLLEKMFTSKNGDKIKTLYEGNTASHGDDESSADMALCSYLAFWTGKDSVQMERIWLASGLGAREKTQKRKDYRDRTITAAIEGCGEVYTPHTMTIAASNHVSDATEENLQRYKTLLAAISKDTKPEARLRALYPLLEDLASTSSFSEAQMFILYNIKDHLELKIKDIDLIVKRFKEIRDELPSEGIEREPRPRISVCPVPEKPVSFDEWAEIISCNFPDLRFAAEVSLSVISQFLVKDITNPFGLVLVDVPSSGKTITINFFDEIPELTYATDKFTPASFVSNSANVSKEELAEIDLLPRLQYRMFLIRDLATLFSKREEDLKEALGLITRIMDGEGLNTDSGVHGQRQYSGEYLFMILAASTPIPPRVIKIMSTLGSRLFFLTMNSRTKGADELAEQIQDLTYKEKEKACRAITRDLLYTLWNKHAEGIEWDRKKEEKKLLLVIGRCARLLAHLRGVIQVWQDDFQNSDYKYSTPTIEKPDRLNQLFYNLARGHAVAQGRTQINTADLLAIVELCIDGAPSMRAALFKHLIEAGGTMSTSEVEEKLNCAKPTALKEMKTLEILEVCTQYERTGHDNEISLSEDFRWFLSNECRKIRGLPETEDAEEIGR